jgi:hypothetical protein
VKPAIGLFFYPFLMLIQINDIFWYTVTILSSEICLKWTSFRPYRKERCLVYVNLIKIFYIGISFKVRLKQNFVLFRVPFRQFHCTTKVRLKQNFVLFRVPYKQFSWNRILSYSGFRLDSSTVQLKFGWNRILSYSGFRINSSVETEFCFIQGSV